MYDFYRRSPLSSLISLIVLVTVMLGIFWFVKNFWMWLAGAVVVGGLLINYKAFLSLIAQLIGVYQRSILMGLGLTVLLFIVSPLVVLGLLLFSIFGMLTGRRSGLGNFQNYSQDFQDSFSQFNQHQTNDTHQRRGLGDYTEDAEYEEIK